MKLSKEMGLCPAAGGRHLFRSSLAPVAANETIKKPLETLMKGFTQRILCKAAHCNVCSRMHVNSEAAITLLERQQHVDHARDKRYKPSCF